MPIEFVDDSLEVAQQEAITDYQSIAGRTLGNADPEMLEANAFALRVSQLRSQMNVTGNQNLITDATGVALEVLGAKNGTFRLPASSAVVTIQFTIAGGAPSLTIPQGTRVKSQDGAALFATDEATVVGSGTGTVDVSCTCITAGVVGNGYTAGMINSIVDPVAYVSGASNIDTSVGGADEESDEALRVRIPLANATYSVAGPEDAYIYFAKTASSSVVDVSIITDLLAGGIKTTTLNAAGATYAAGDIVTVNGGTILAKIQVLTVSSGAVATYKVIKKGSGYGTGTAIVTTTVTGAGSGFKVNITVIMDVMTVQIYPLLAGGAIPNGALLQAVEDICSDKKVRPLSDTVAARAPTNVDYTLTVHLTAKRGYNTTELERTVAANLNGFVNQWNKALGVDLVLDQYKGQCMIPGVYDVDIPSFTADVVIDENEFGNCTSVTVSVVNIVDER